jgi:ribosomal protein L31
VEYPSNKHIKPDSANANLLHDQAVQQAHQLHSTSSSNTMDDSVSAAHFPLYKADHQFGAEIPATSITTAVADSVDDSFPRDQADHQIDPELPSTPMTSAQSYG